MTMNMGASVKSIVLGALLILGMASGAAAQAFGAIGGTVDDPSGAALPGATVVLSNPGVIGGAQEAITDARGAYQFGRLVPGTYSVRATLTGFRTSVQEGIVVNADVTARADLRLEIGTLAETIVVSGQAPLLDTVSTYRQTVLDQKTLEVLPTGRDIWSIGRLVPALVVGKYDVGGSESMYASDVTLHGALKAEGNFLVDGVDVSNTSSPGQSGLYPDPGMFEEINYQAGNAPAENDRGGVIMSLVSRTGSNKFRGRFGTIGSYKPLSANNLTTKQRADLVASLPARLLALNPNFVPTTRIKSLDNSSVDASGPIVRDRLWFSASGQLAHVNKYWLGNYTTDGNQVLDDSDQHGWSAKASWQAGPRTQLHYLHTYSKRINHHRTATALGTANDFYDERAMTTQFLPVYFDQVRLTSTLSSRLVFEVMAARFHIGVAAPPANSSVGPGDIPHFDNVTRTYTVAFPSGSTTSFKGNPINASLSYLAGGHEVKFGYQLKDIGIQMNTYTFSHYPTGLLAITRNGVPDSVNTYNTPVDTDQRQLDQAWYVQDKWRVSRKLTVNVGLRLQKSRGSIPAGCQPQTIFIDGRCFDEIENVPNWLDLAPRFGLIYDIFGNGRTALKIAANRYDIPVGPAFSSNVNPIKLTNDTRPWVDLNGDGDPQLNELGVSTGFNLGTTNRYNPDVKRPYTNELNAEIQQQFGGGLVVSAGFFYRGVRRQLGSKNVAVPRESYTPIQVIEVGTGQAVTVYNQDPALRGKFDVLFDNFSEIDNDFNGVDVNFNKRFGNRWMIMGGLSLGRNLGDVYGTADLNNPNNTFRRGVVGLDVPVSFKLSGMYELPHGVSVSGNVSHYTGFPELDTVTVSRDTVALTQVSQSLAIAPRGTNRLDDVNFVDLSARKTFRISGNRSVEPLLELFNVLNASAVQGRATALGPAYHRVAAVTGGRMLKLGVNVKF
jgi:hypothetical protein